ncbi:MAG: signal peptidase I [Candidatus Rhabdochlamydia sp.]
MKAWFQLRKSKKVLIHVYLKLQQVKHRLPDSVYQEIKGKLQELQEAILTKQVNATSNLIKSLNHLYKKHLKKTSFKQIVSSILGILFALFIAMLIRQMWFELYEIPTGSMRPTFKELDRLSVSKTAFGVNHPFTTGHFYFNQELIKRNNIVIFTTENMDFRDSDTLYFYLFPGKKMLVKRAIGKPGDTLYFYGGQIYGVNAQNKDISHKLRTPELEKIDHIPFISFEGTRLSTTTSIIPGVHSPVMIYQMNEPIARCYALSSTQAKGELLPRITKRSPGIHYNELWGIGNYAMARLLTKEQVRVLSEHDPSQIEEGLLYLELRHHPNLENTRMGYDEMHRLRPLIGLSTSIIPLQESHLKALMHNLYTARFIVDKGFAYRYGVNPQKFGAQAFFPYFPGIPDGTYEFYYGKASSIGWQGISHELPLSHPLYWFDLQRTQLLFNIGMEFDTRYNPQGKEQSIYPSRYAYFREGNLYLMGAPIILKDDPALIRFIEREEKRKNTSRTHYEPFIDAGAPLLSDGSLDIEKVKKYGLTVPPKMYLVLGDNHANSGDSREFGFVPEANLKGGPSFIFWPPGHRFGAPNQPSYALLNPGRVVVWSLACISILGWMAVQRKRTKLPLKF